MSKFIKDMFCEKGDKKPYSKEIQIQGELSMRNDVQELFPFTIEYTFNANWQMVAAGKADEYEHLHKIALKALKRNIYGEFFDKLTELELSLYDRDIKSAKILVQEIKKEVGL